MISLKMKKVVLIAIASIFLSACSLPFPFASSKKSALNVTSEQSAAVFLDEEHMGTTPFRQDDLKPGEYTVKLQLESDPGRTWQTQVSLKPQLLTSISRSFGPTDEESSYFVLTLEELSKDDDVEIAIVSLPDSVVVKVDGQPVGFSPVNVDTLAAGDHEIVLGSPGYTQLTIPVKTIEGHKLTISAQLAKEKGLEQVLGETSEATESARPKAIIKSSSDKDESQATGSGTLERPYVTITETETGWLRVRSGPTTYEDNEVAKVDVGESFSFIEKNDTGWFQIEYEEGELGWISGKFADLFQ